jgi:hypothetical protein
MTRFLLNLALDLLFGKQEKIERITCPPPRPPRTPGIGLPETKGGKP